MSGSSISFGNVEGLRDGMDVSSAQHVTESERLVCQSVAILTGANYEDVCLLCCGKDMHGDSFVSPNPAQASILDWIDLIMDIVAQVIENCDGLNSVKSVIKGTRRSHFARFRRSMVSPIVREYRHSVKLFGGTTRKIAETMIEQAKQQGPESLEEIWGEFTDPGFTV